MNSAYYFEKSFLAIAFADEHQDGVQLEVFSTDS